MKKLILQLCIAAFCFLFATTTRAQSLEGIKSQMVKDWERAKDYTKEYLDAMPADKYNFKANDSVRSFAQQMLHLAGVNVGLMSMVSKSPMPAGIGFGTEQRTSAQQKDSVVHYVMESYNYAINVVKNSDVSKWSESQKVFNRFNETQYAIMNKAFEHQTHTRGQTTIYLRLAGVRPPGEKLF